MPKNANKGMRFIQIAIQITGMQICNIVGNNKKGSFSYIAKC